MSEIINSKIKKDISLFYEKPYVYPLKIKVDENYIDIFRPDIINFPEFKGISTHASYARFLIDIKNKSLSIWILDGNKKDPDRIINNCIL